MSDSRETVLLMNDSFPPQIDGVATAVTQYARFFQKNHGDAVVAVPYYQDAEDDYPFPVVRYPSLQTEKLVGYRTGFPFHSQTVRKLGEYPLTLIHSHCPFVSTYLGRLVREQKNIPLVMTYHTKFDIDIRKAVRSEALQKAAIRIILDNISACDEVWTVSRGAMDNLRSLGFEGEIRLMENGVDFPRGVPDPAAREAFAAELKKTCGIDRSAGYPVFLFVGRLMWYKGIRLILDAFRSLRAEGLPFRAVFVGDGMDGPEIRAYAERSGLSDACVFAGPVRDRETLRLYYSSATLFLFPSTFDTNGIVVREAAACGLPALLIRGSCAAEGVEDGVNGILTEESAESVAAALRAVCADPALCAPIGERAQRTLYLSGEDAVARAADRYREVEESYRASPKPAECPSEEAIVRILDLISSLNRIQDRIGEIQSFRAEVVREGERFEAEQMERVRTLSERLQELLRNRR